jgi:hypothetical protein
MASVPLSMQQLEDIAVSVSRELLEQWAIDERFAEDKMAEAAAHAIDDTIFVINAYMEHVNYHMMNSEDKGSIIIKE